MCKFHSVWSHISDHEGMSYTCFRFCIHVVCIQDSMAQLIYEVGIVMVLVEVMP